MYVCVSIHCNCSASSPRPKFITIAEVVATRFKGWSVTCRRLIGDCLPTEKRLVGDLVGPLCDLMQLVADRSGTGPRLVADQSPIGRRLSQLKIVTKKKSIDNMVHILFLSIRCMRKINGCKDYTIMSVEIGRSVQP